MWLILHNVIFEREKQITTRSQVSAWPTHLCLASLASSPKPLISAVPLMDSLVILSHLYVSVHVLPSLTHLSDHGRT